MSRYGIVHLYGVRSTFIFSLLCVVFNCMSEPANYLGVLVNVAICIGCIFSREIAIQYYETRNIEFIY